jgi:hypothetical protein
VNIVELIKGQLGDDVLGKLGSLIGESEDKTRSAVGAAVPGLLAILAQLASTSGGADKVINSLKQVDPTPDGGFGDILAGPKAPEVQEKGSSLINILLGSAALPVILKLLSKFSGIAAGSAKGLLGYLMPVILSMLAKQLTGGGRALTPQGLSSFFAEQKDNIGSALPSGFSLADIPGLGAVSAAPRAVSGPAAAEGGLPSWLLPLVGLGLLGLIAWWFLGQPTEPTIVNPPGAAPTAAPAGRPVVPKAEPVAPKAALELPDPAKLGTDLNGVYTTLMDVLGGVKDAGTAGTAVSKLAEMGPKLDGLKSLWEKLPEAGRTAVAKVTTDHLAKLKELVAKVLALPGVGEKLKPVLDAIVAQLATFATG